MRRSISISVVVAGIAIVVLFPFQNCSKPKLQVIEQAVQAKAEESLSQVAACAENDLSCAQTCEFNNKSYLLGESVRAYQQALVPYQSVCVSEERVCAAAGMSGSYMFATCEVGQPIGTEVNDLCQSIDKIQGDMRVDIQKVPGAAMGTESILEFGTFADNYWLGSSRGEMYDRELNFFVGDKTKVTSFLLKKVAFDDWMRLKINGQIVYIGPRAGDRLELIDGMVQYGLNNFSQPELSTSWQIQLNTELQAYLVDGKNTIEMRTIVSGAGEGALQILMKSSCPQ